MALSKQKILIFDCQTTGSTPSNACLLEAGWVVVDQKQPRPSESVVLRLASDQQLPNRIAAMTGITQQEVNAGISNSQLLDLLAPSKDMPWVIHYARFERPFIEQLFGTNYHTPKIVCTYEIARRLYPDLPSKGIRALAGYLGHPIEEMKRAAHHAEATLYIWNELCDQLERRGVNTFNELDLWLTANKPRASGQKTYALDSKIRLNLPEVPGVYFLKDAKGGVLYIGKATNLKSRVNSYFRGRKTKGSRLNEMITQVLDIEFEETLTPLQSALIETDQIKVHNPPYNLALKTATRAVRYFDLNFHPIDPKALTHGLFIGPCPNEALAAQFQNLLSCYALGSVEDLKFLDLNDPLIYKQGFELFCAGHEVSPEQFRTKWTKIAMRCWRDQLRRQDLEVETNESQETYDLDEIQISNAQTWEPEDVKKYLERFMAHIISKVHRQRWLLRLTDSTLVWRNRKARSPWYALEMTNGRATFRKKKSKEKSPAKPCQRRHQINNLDLPTYDRLNVLMTEIRRLLTDDAKIKLYSPGCRELNEEDLAYFMFPGIFYTLD
jgi:DNA polymerase III subunit epsilon